MIKIAGLAAAGIFGIALIVLLIVGGPLATIWALNTLFPALAIPYTFWTWLAALVLAATVSSSKG
jgi:hypothetical protein